jgi:hypothetical protein
MKNIQFERKGTGTCTAIEEKASKSFTSRLKPDLACLAVKGRTDDDKRNSENKFRTSCTHIAQDRFLLNLVTPPTGTGQPN